VSDDHVVALSVFPEDAATMRAWRHWTVLAGSGEPPLSQEVGARLVSSGATTTDVPDLQRALGRRWPVAPQPPRVGSEGSATEVVLATLAELNDELRRHDPLVRAERHDAVHRMRVTTRRLRSVLATFRPLFDRGLTDSLREELQWFAGLLGGARDAEVLSRRIIRELDDQPAQQVRGPVRAFVDQELRARYEEHHQRCVQAMTSSRYFDLVDRLDALVVHPRWSDRAESAGPDLLRARVRHNLRRLDRRIAGVKLALDDDERTHRLHDVRKAAKRARYSAEALQPTYGRDAQRLAKSMRRVQRVLGEHQDTVVARHELQRLSDRATAAGVNGYSFGVLERVLAQAGATAQSRLDDVWRRAARPKRRAWLQG
jgi:CHAD domain-containing protein